MALPHIAKNDVFTYKNQFNHEKILNTPLDSFHIHFIPVGTVTAGQIIAIDYAWAWLTKGNEFPDVLPNTGTAYITLKTGDQYDYLIDRICQNMPPPDYEAYSSEFFIECQRRNDSQDTYPGEFALLDGDNHFLSDKLGSKYEHTDEED